MLIFMLDKVRVGRVSRISSYRLLLFVCSVNRGKNEVQIKTNLFGKGRLTTSIFHCTASSGEQQHLFVKSDDKRMHYDGMKFVVRNAAQSAGFNSDKEKLCIY